MADLAIGISKTVLEALVNKVQTAIKEEAELWQTLQSDTVFMKDEFEMMQSFLKTADGQRVRNDVVRTWVRQVRDLSYDAEDRIESVLLINTKRSFWTFFLRLLASCNCSSQETSPLDQAVAEVKLLKARVKDVSDRNNRYSLLNGSSGSNSGMPQQASSTAIGTSKTTALDILTEAWSTAKKQGGLMDLAILVNEDSSALRVISLWETGGDHGMSSIIKGVYEKTDICQKFKSRAWLKLAHPFNPHEFIRSLAHQFHVNSCKEGESQRVVDLFTATEGAQAGTNLVNEFVHQLNKNRYLVVIEGLSNMAEWHAVRTYLPDTKNGSRIVVSTQHLEIARLCAGQKHQVSKLKKSPDNHSVCVFFHEGFQRINGGMVDGGSPLFGADELIGRNSEKEELLKLVSWAAGCGNAHVISVCGFPGVGKSALVRSIIHHCKVKKMEPSFFDRFFWVDVSYSFSFSTFCRRMHSFMRNQPSETTELFGFRIQESTPDEQIIQECTEFLKRSRCLVVIDGLRSMKDWDSMKSLIPLPSRVLVITAQKDIARYCAQQDAAIYEVKALQFKEALQLFQKEFGETQAFRDEHMLKDTKYVLSKCGGIPETILALAKFLRMQSEDPGKLKLKLSRLKANFMHELETNPEFVCLQDLFAWMHFCYDELPQCLKPCILYQSVFPHDKSIRRSRFVRRWIAEGYSKGSDSKTMEEYAGVVFNMLARQTAIVPALRDNSFFHEYVKSRLMEERVVFFPPEVNLLDEGRSITADCQGQHLTIARSWKRQDEFLYEEWDFSHLQSLTVDGQWSSFIIPCMMRSLRVLDLEGTQNVDDDEFERFLKLLPRLRLLSLRGLKEITRLPDSLYGLRHLQALDIRGTSVVYIELQKLQKLQYIRAGTVPWTDVGDLAAGELSTPSKSISTRPLVSCLPKILRCGPVIPRHGIMVRSKGIRHLTLHTLGTININNTEGGAVLNEICHLKHLKKLEVSGINRKNSKKLSQAIINQKNLESLSLQLDKEKQVVQWNLISPPSSVRSFKLYGHVEELPGRIKHLQNLRKLSLEMTRLLKADDIKLLGSVPNLHTLRLLVSKYHEGDLDISSKLFPKLQEFKIACRSWLHVNFDKETMVKLEIFKVHCANKSVMEISGLQGMGSLKQVLLEGSFVNQLTGAVKEQLVNHSPKPSLKLNNKLVLF